MTHLTTGTQETHHPIKNANHGQKPPKLLPPKSFHKVGNHSFPCQEAGKGKSLQPQSIPCQHHQQECPLATRHTLAKGGMTILVLLQQGCLTKEEGLLLQDNQEAEGVQWPLGNKHRSSFDQQPLIPGDPARPCWTWQGSWSSN